MQAMKTKYLSAEEREEGITHYLKFATFNGLGFSFLGATPVYLLALHFGASNTQIGYLSSVIHVSGLILLFLPRLLAGKNIIRVQSGAWILRGLVCALYGSLLFVTGQTAVVIIMGIYTLFCLVRTVGVAMWSPVQQMLSTSSTTGEIVVRTSNRFQTTRLVSLFISFFVLSVKHLGDLAGLLFLQMLGIILNTVSTIHLKRVPCREVVEYRQGRNIFAIFMESLRNKKRTLTLLVKWQTLSLTVMFAFVIPFLRKIMHFPSNMVFIYTITVTLATVSAGYFLKPFADRIGSKPLLIMASFLLAALGIIWSILPPSIPWSVILVLGFATGFFQHMSMLLVTRLVLKSMPGKDKIGYTSMINFFSAIFSLVVGLLGGMLADFGEYVMISGFNPFGFTFLLTAGLALINGTLCAFLRDPGSLSVKETLNILFSTRNLKAFLDIYQLNITGNPMKRKSILLSIEQSNTSIATDEIQRIIKHPLSPEKGEVLKSLFEYPRPALLDDLIQEALDSDSYQRQTAVFALGAYPNDEQVEQTLISLLDDPSMRIRSTAAKSLARVGNTTYLEKIPTLSEDPSTDLWAAMNYFIAISIMDQQGKYLKKLFDSITDSRGPSYEQTMFSLAAKMLEGEPALSELYQEENIANNAGLKTLLEEAKQLQPFLQHTKTLYANYSQGSYQEIWGWCRELLEQKKIEGPFSYLCQSINTYDLDSVNKENTLAALYFTYQILK